MNDEFPSDVARHKYDPNAFYVSSTDTKGHCERKYVKFAPDIWNRVCAVASDSTTPYRSGNDYVRNAVVHQLNRDAMLDDADPTFVQHVAEITAQAAIESEFAVLETRTRLIKRAEELLKLAISSPPAEKARLFAMLRIQSVGVSDEVRDEIGKLIQRYER